MMWTRLSLVLLVVVLATGAGSRSAAKTQRDAERPTQEQTIQRLAEKMLPAEKLNRALGFFGPVSKRYLPVFNRFNREYQTSEAKIAIIRKYLPKADAALAEARAMKVPPKYEAEKAEYIRLATAFLAVLRMTVCLSE